MTEKTIETSSSSGATQSSVNSLIQHNQDLASRLNVSISRNIELEKRLNRFKKVHAQYEERFQSARDQVAIHKEKEKFLTKENLTVKQKLQNTNAHLAQERKEAKSLQEKLEQELESAKPYVNEYRNLKNKIEKDYLPERDLLKARLQEEAEKIERLELEKTDLFKKLSEASSHIQLMAQDFKKTDQEKKSKYEAEVSNLKKRLDDTLTENIVLSDRNRVLRKEQIEKTELLNRIEELKKEKEISFKDFQNSKEDLLLQVSKFKQENDRIKIENHDLKKQWSKTQTEFRAYKKEAQASQDEASSLRALWQEKTSTYENVEKQSQALSSDLAESEALLKKTSDMHKETKQRLNFFFDQLSSMKEKQASNEKLATEAMEKAFKKAIELFTDFDYNL